MVKATRLQWAEACGRWGNGGRVETTFLSRLVEARREGRGQWLWGVLIDRPFFFFFKVALNFSLFSEPAIIFNNSVALQMFFPLLVMPPRLLCQLESFRLFKAKLKFHPPWCFSGLLQAEAILLIPMLHNMTLTPSDELAGWIIKLCLLFFIAAWAPRRGELCLVFSARLLNAHSLSQCRELNT